MPQDFVIATGITTRIRDFVFKAFKKAGIEVTFEGEGEEEIGRVVKSEREAVKEGQLIVRVDSRYFRPTEVDLLLGDNSKAKELLNWEPKYGLDQLIEEMVESDLKLFESELYLLKGGHKVLNTYE
mgnify:CR=1 FL=1